MNLPICQGSGVLGAVHAVSAVQVLALYGGQTHDAEGVAHAEHGDHLPCQVSGALDVVAGAGGGGMEDHFFRRTATQQDADAAEKFFLAVEELLLLRRLHGVAQGALGVGDDGDLAHRLRALLTGGDEGVAYLVVGDELLLLFGEHGALLFGTGDDHFKGGE